MKCLDYQSVLVDAGREELMPASARDEALAHARLCERCAARIADERSLTAGMGALAESHAACEAPAHVELRLLAAFREQQRIVAPVSRARSARWRPRKWAAAAAVVVMIVIGASAWVKQRSIIQLLPASDAAKSEPAAPTSNEKPAVSTASPGVSPVSPVRGSRSINARRSFVASRAKRAPGVPETTSEITTDFMPLSFAQSPASDGLQLVRVELPRSTLVSFGLPVNSDRAGQPIKADVVLGHDGVARAIRFVH